jgi:hypothetical protein
MSSNAIAAVAVVLVSGFAGCAATAKAEPVIVGEPAMSPAAPVKIAEAAPLRTVTISADGLAVYRERQRR